MTFIRKSEIGNGKSTPGFTLVELLVVIAIIGVLVGITIPLVSKVRKSSQEAATRALITQIDAACQAYYTDFNAYPGPFSHTFMTTGTQTTGPGDEPIYESDFSTPVTDNAANPGPTGMGNDVKRLTGTEALVIGLVGGLQQRTNPANPADVKYGFNRDQLGLGPVRFSTKRPGRSNPYMQATSLSEGKFTDDASQLNPAKDTSIPEFIDSFTNPLPILYMRARTGGLADSQTALGLANNNIVIDQTNSGASARGQYNLIEIAAYTQSSIGIGRSVKQSEYRNHAGSFQASPHGLLSIGDPKTSTIGKKSEASSYPYDAYAYLLDPASDSKAGAARTDVELQKNRARNQDRFVLISAGIDRTYGTEDDITNFGSVLP